MIRASNLAHTFSGSDFHLQCAEIHANRGALTCVVGPNGSGKTTLLQILGGRISPHKGEVIYQDNPIAMASRDVLAREIGWIDSNACNSLVPELLVVDHLALALKAGRQYVPFFHRKLHLNKHCKSTRMSASLLEEVREILHQRVAEISAGQRQSLTIALALVNPRSLILTDEGTSALDLKNARHFFKSMRGLTRDHVIAVLAVTHDILLACEYGDEIYTVRDRIAEDNRRIGVVERFEMQAYSTIDQKCRALENLLFLSNN